MDSFLEGDQSICPPELGIPLNRMQAAAVEQSRKVRRTFINTSRGTLMQGRWERTAKPALQAGIRAL